MYFLLGAIYFVGDAGTMMFRKRHFVLFWLGIVFPVSMDRRRPDGTGNRP